MIALILYLISQLTILGPGVLSQADPGVLESVAQRRIHYGYGLEAALDVNDYEVLIAPADCDLLGRDGWLVANGHSYRAIVVDCEARHHRGQMQSRGLLADVNNLELVHKQGWVILR